jgi:hypothetical protein
MITPPGGHASQSGQPAASEEVEDGTLDNVVGRVRQKDGFGAGFHPGGFQERVAQAPSRVLERSPGQLLGTAASDQPHTQASAELGNMIGVIL